ncbi:MAG: M67 family metallopeptidase [Mariprofundaceae bacterium]|nr:M67 family metallopeptidase [Mariprofundaceae bacterium]
MENDLHEPERFRSPEYMAVVDTRTPDQHCHFSTASLQRMRQAAEEGYPLEVCGLLIGHITARGWHVNEVRPVRNLNNERAADRFQLDPDAYQIIDRELRGSGREIIGVYHSHPDCPARPSPTDLEHAWEGFAYPIVSVCDGRSAEIRCWAIHASGDRFVPVAMHEDPS